MDDRLYQVEQQKQAALNQSNEMYQGLLNDNQNLYNEQKQYAEQQEQIQNEMLDKQLANQRQEIEKQKNVANQNFKSEQKRAKNEYESFINPYGVQAEREAQYGLANSGYSETTKLGGFNAYQNRLASANKAMQDAFTQYDSDMNKAILNNDVQKAQNALNKLQMQLQYSQDFYTNKSSLSQNQLTNNQDLDNNYFNRYEQVYGDIQAEKAAAEAIRQWEAEFAEQQRQYNERLKEEQRQYNERLAYEKEAAARELAYKQEQSRIAQQQWEQEYALSRQKVNQNNGPVITGQTQNTGLTSANNFGNNQNTIKKSDYYFKASNGENYQPRYVNNTKLEKTGKQLKDVGEIPGIKGDKNIWTADGRYYVWSSANGEYEYVDITQYMK